jgi:hypothetical protein
MKAFECLNFSRVCGAKTRAGNPCKNAVMVPALRCSKHGGKTPIKHGKRSKLTQNLRKQAKLLRMEMKQIDKKILQHIKQ